MTSIEGEKRRETKPKIEKESPSLKEEKEEILTDEEKKFVEKMSERYINMLWTRKKLREAKARGGISGKLVSKIEKDLEKMDEPISDMSEYLHIVVETSIKNIGLGGEFLKKREEVFNKDAKFFEMALGKNLPETTKKVFKDYALMKVLGEVVNSEERTSEYRKETAKVNSRLFNAVGDAKKRASDLIEETTNFEEVEKQR